MKSEAFLLRKTILEHGTLRKDIVTRELYKTPDGEVSAEFSRVCQLFQQALPGASDRYLFDCLMNEASSLGLNWVDGLQYVVERREQLQTESGSSPAFRPAVDGGAETA